MTCIVGLVDNGRVIIGGDSAGVSGMSLSIRADEKVFKVGEMAFGFSTSFRMGQLLRYSLPDLELPHASDTLMGYMTTYFINAVRKCLKEGGYSWIENNKESAGQFLVGVRGRLFMVDNDFQVAERVAPYCAIGCGRDLALGSLYTMQSLRLDIAPRQQVVYALTTAQSHNAGVAEPFNIVETG